MTNYESLSMRIKEASDDKGALLKLEKRVTNHYDLGMITVKDLINLDSVIMLRIAKIDSSYEY